MILMTRNLKMNGDTNQYMLRKKPLKPKFKEVFGHYRLAYGDSTLKIPMYDPEEDEEDV